MDNARLKFISKPFGGVVLLTVVHIAFPSVSLAQNQLKQPTTQIKTSPQRQAVPTTTQRKTTSQSQAVPAATTAATAISVSAAAVAAAFIAASAPARPLQLKLILQLPLVVAAGHFATLPREPLRRCLRHLLPRAVRAVKAPASQERQGTEAAHPILWQLVVVLGQL